MTHYLDFNATTPVDPVVVDAMVPYLTERFGNPASAHPVGRSVRDSVEDARGQVAELLGVSAGSVIWTSGATEALNAALKGLAGGSDARRRRVVYSTAEHKAVLDTVHALTARNQIEAIAVEVRADSTVDPAALAQVVDEQTLAICVMAANNETGAVNDIERIGEVAHKQGALFVCDATQQVGKLPVDLSRAGVDYATVSAHKMYGPKGVGALVVQPAVDAPDLEPLIHGGGHQRGLRSGTLNVPGIVGFGAAAALAERHLADGEPARQARLRDRLERFLDKKAGPITVHSHDAPRLPNTTNIRFHGVDADALIVNCPQVAMSSGSACTSSVPSPSHVLTAMGLTSREAEESIRLSLGRFTTESEIDEAVEFIAAATSRIREVSQ